MSKERSKGGKKTTTRKIEHAYKIMVGKYLKKRPLGRQKIRDNIHMCLRRWALRMEDGFGISSLSVCVMLL